MEKNLKLNTNLKIAVAILVALVAVVIFAMTNQVNASYLEAYAEKDRSVVLTNGAKTEYYWKIVSGDSAYTNFCLKGGDALHSTRMTSYNKQESVFSLVSATTYFHSLENYKSAMWLLDNAYISSVDDNTKAVLKANLISQMNDQNAIAALGRLSDAQIIAVENCVLWRLVPNTNDFYDNASVEGTDAQAVFNHLLTVTLSHSDYTGHTDVNATIAKGTNFTINTSNGKAGPFTSNVELNTNNLYVTVNNQSVSGFTVSGDTTNGYYITVPANTLTTGNGVTNSIVLQYKGIKTTAHFIRKTDATVGGRAYQNLVAVTKSLVNVKGSASDTTEVQELDLALVKTIKSYEHGSTSISVDRFNPNKDISIAALDNNTSTDATYMVNKYPVNVQKGDIITYRIYVFNEGQVDADAHIVDYLPAGLKLVDDNKEWNIEGSVTANNVQYTKITSKTLTKQIKAHTAGNALDYDFIEVTCEVENTAQVGTIYRNYAEIIGFTSANQNVTKDRDSQVRNIRVSDYVNTVSGLSWLKTCTKSTYDQQDDDDFEQVKIINPGFDLALRKYISKVNNVETRREPQIYGIFNSTVLADSDLMVKFLKSGDTTFVYDHDKTTVKVKKGDLITYTIRIYNEGLAGDYNGYASQIIDYLPAGVEYNATATAAANQNIAWIDSITQDGRTLTITADNGDSEYNKDIETTNVLKYYAKLILNPTGADARYYQEVNIVCNVATTAEENTVLTNVAYISEYRMDKGNLGYETINATNEAGATQLTLDRDSTVSTQATDSATSILAAAALKLANYQPEYESYVPGVQDDDDFESVIIERIIDNHFKFNVKKVGTTGQSNEYNASSIPVSGIGIIYDNDSNSIVMTNGSGYAKKIYVDPVTTQKSENIPVNTDWLPNEGTGTPAAIQTTKIQELQTSDMYVPIEQPVYAYYTFNAEGDVDQVKISTILYEGQNLIDNFAGMSNVATVNLANTGAINVKIEKFGNEITVTIPNPTIKGEYNLTLVKVDESENPVEGIDFKVNNKVDTEKTNSNGQISVTTNLAANGTGWGFDEFEEVNANLANGNRYVKLQKPIKVYRYTEIVNFKYKVTKIGLGMKQGEYVNVSNTAQELEKDVILETGETVTLTLNIPAETTVGITTATLTVPNKLIEGQYEVKILKVNQNDQPIEGVKFVVNGTQTAATGADGIVSLGTKNITSVGFDSFSVSEVQIGNKYAKLQDIITVHVLKAQVYGRYRAVTAYFDRPGASQVKTVLLTDGSEAQLELDVTNGVVTLKIPNKEIFFDLALQKFITGVNSNAVTGREPVFSITDGKYVYTPEFDNLSAVEVANSDVVTYTLRVYNEGEIDGYAAEIMDDIPEGVEFVKYTPGDASINDTYKWVMYREAEEGETTTPALTRVYDEKTYVVTDDVTKAKFIRTEYLSKEAGEDRMAAGDTVNPNLIKAFKPATMDSPNYKEVKVQFKVKYEVKSVEDTSRVIVNYAQITEDTDSNGNEITDKDSTTNKWIDGEDDQDREKIKVKYFDLALVKWVSEAIVIEDGKETIHEGNKETDIPEPTLKVDLKKSKLDKVVVKFKYQIKVTNQGEIAGYVKEISDYIPQGLKFVAADNTEFGWEEKDGKVVTSYLEDTILQPDESATVTIVLTWINGEDNLGEKTNIAEISKDYNNKNDTSDIDSTPNNQILDEDDIDDAKIILTVTTGEKVVTTYIILGLSVVGLISTGTILIKKFVLVK